MHYLIFILELFCDLYFNNVMHATTESSRLIHTWNRDTEAELQKYRKREILKLSCRSVIMLANVQESSESNLKKQSVEESSWIWQPFSCAFLVW